MILNINFLLQCKQELQAFSVLTCCLIEREFVPMQFVLVPGTMYMMFIFGFCDQDARMPVKIPTCKNINYNKIRHNVKIKYNISHMAGLGSALARINWTR